MAKRTKKANPVGEDAVGAVRYSWNINTCDNGFHVNLSQYGSGIDYREPASLVFTNPADLLVWFARTIGFGISLEPPTDSAD